MQFRSKAAQENGLLIELGKDVFFHPPFSTFSSDALDAHNGKVSIGGRTITNLRFADDIDAFPEEGQVLEALVESLVFSLLSKRSRMC